MAKIDIIMPLYNKASTVIRAVESICNQTYKDWRLIIVNDGSTDSGPEAVAQRKDKRIEIINQANQGPGAARNTGISLATAEYLAFLDADDEWYPWYLGNSIEAIEKNKVAMVSAMYYEWPKKNDMTSVWSKRGVRPGIYFLEGTESPVSADWLLCFAHVGTTVIRTDIARKYGGFYTVDKCLLTEDTIFFWRIGLNEPFMVISPAAVRHHLEDSGLACNRLKMPVPFFDKPEIIVDYCPEHKRAFALQVIAHIALRTAIEKARHGLKNEAIELAAKFPDIKKFQADYRRFRYVLALSKLYPFWVKAKCGIGAPIKTTLKNIARNSGIIHKIPDI